MERNYREHVKKQDSKSKEQNCRGCCSMQGSIRQGKHTANICAKCGRNFPSCSVPFLYAPKSSPSKTLGKIALIIHSAQNIQNNPNHLHCPKHLENSPNYLPRPKYLETYSPTCSSSSRKIQYFPTFPCSASRRTSSSNFPYSIQQASSTSVS